MRGILRYTVSVHRIRHNRIMTHTKQPFPENTRQNTSTCALPTCKRQSPAYVLTHPAKHPSPACTASAAAEYDDTRYLVLRTGKMIGYRTTNDITDIHAIPVSTWRGMSRLRRHSPHQRHHAGR